MEQIGIVMKTNGDRATVSVARASACEGCHRHAEGCTACSLLGGDTRHTATVSNPIGAKEGDLVQIYAPEGRILFYAALVFLFPILLAAAAYLLASAFLGDNLLAVGLLTAGGFLLAFLIVYIVSVAVSKKAPIAGIVKVINNKRDGEE